MKKYLLLHEFLDTNYSSTQGWTKTNEKHIARFVLNGGNDQTLEHIFEYLVSGRSFYLHVLLYAAAGHKILGSDEVRWLQLSRHSDYGIKVSSDLQNLQICSESGIMK